MYTTQFYFQEIQFIPKRGSNGICVPYTLTAGNTGSDIIGLSQDTLVIAYDVSE